MVVAASDACNAEVGLSWFQPDNMTSTISPYPWRIVWKNVILLSTLHILGFWGVYRGFTSLSLKAFVFVLVYGYAGGLGITAGSHRLWTHRSYKASWQLRLMLIILQTSSLHGDAYAWARDHRVHHKYTETDADPHNAKRGFFFSHVGWLLLRKHRDVISKGDSIDLSDVMADPFVAWQRWCYPVAAPLLGLVLPICVPIYFWNEDIWDSTLINVSRVMVMVNITWLVNSAAHLFGDRPYDKNINPSENMAVALVALGEGWHNYHHVYPWDYKTGELGNHPFNLTTVVINLFAKIGWAYDLKTVSPRSVLERVARTGDGSHPSATAPQQGDELHQHPAPVWGWGDEDLGASHAKQVCISYQSKLVGKAL